MGGGGGTCGWKGRRGGGTQYGKLCSTTSSATYHFEIDLKTQSLL